MSDNFNGAPIKPQISFADFEKVDIHVGTIERVEDIEGADTLMRLMANFGNETKKVIAGIKKERANLREIEGRKLYLS